MRNHHTARGQGVPVLEVHGLLIPAVAGGDRTRPPVQKDAQFGVAEPVGNLVLRGHRLPGQLIGSRLHGQRLDEVFTGQIVRAAPSREWQR